MRRQINISWRAAFLFVLVWFISATILLDVWPIVRSEGEWETITNAQYGFSVDYPTKWNARTYGEHGFKGGDEIKLRIYRSLRGVFVITAKYLAMPNPTLNDVAVWGKSEIDNSIANIISQGKKSNFALMMSEETVVNGHPVIRMRYRLGSAMYESVYIARSNDMIILTLQANETEFEQYLEDFDAIVISFRPLE